MILSFPNMGPNVYAFKTLFEQLDIDVVLPDPTNREAIKIGVKYSPEFVCFPFKATLGDFVSAIKKGADTLVMAIDCGPCRFGFYHAVQERLLHDMGYKNVNIIPLDQADLLEFKWVKTLQELSGRKDLFAYSKFVKAVIFFLKKAKLLSDIQTAEGLFRAYERNQGDTTKVFKTVINKLDQANNLKELRSFKKVIKEDFNKIDVDRTRTPLRVAIFGEIHISLEPFVNVDIRRKLGEMGCEIHQNLSLWDWVSHKFHLNFHRKWLEHLSHPYVPMDIGGECQWVLGEYIDRAKSGFDGAVHCYPFTCMPEVTARTIITNKLKKMYDLPIIYFSFDEHSGTEGMRTRLEAFVDLMNSRRKHKLGLEKISLEDQKNNFYKSNGSHFFHECVKLIQT
ncbi:MAG: acyl-CoA dehydratase activase-related protein [Promethearchaeota archaeon]|jgi:predicted nucleotide-binding protein (sugar kinase/HSP70/actin superfamily)